MVEPVERVGMGDLRPYNGIDKIAEFWCPKCERRGNEGLLYLEEENQIGEPVYRCQTCADLFIVSIYSKDS